MQTRDSTHANAAELLARALQGLCSFERSAAPAAGDARSRDFLRQQLLLIVEQRAARLQGETRAMRRNLPEL
ncbi:MULTISPECIES: hypothetical protein [Ramlibacter]|uniref:Uncharacterized protein n=1 Tax=Ramlibacter aquaticus TaxID=2780094 RepID=A0ABR9SIW8_9BURK|nr:MULTISPECIES: hypothetical protein [Ramlibacter]MBE7942298.1 hypothetical protein [Ramlibacter aquaticus]